VVAGADSITPTTTVLGQSILPTAYADTLNGMAGNDTLNGGAGGDSLVGGAGDDLYVVDSAGDTIVELAGEGVDRVQSSVSYTLGAHVEQLALTGSANTTATGNELANILAGNSGQNFVFGLGGDDALDGAGGHDTLDGGLGRDTLTGGSGDDRLIGGADADLYVGSAGKDVFYLERGLAAGDAIQDFAKGDKVHLAGYSTGSTVTRVAGSSTDWLITDKATGATELFKLLNGYALKGGDFLFV
jgi:Ca2+-binding RTX toxin-like protein